MHSTALRNSLIGGLMAALAGFALPARAADVGVSIGISQPGVHGRIDIGRYPQPVVVTQQPVIITPPPRYYQPEPVYMWVPPGHQRHWRNHCGRYNACGRPVYFVRDDWYRDNVYRSDSRREERRDWRDDRRDDRRDDWRDERRNGRGGRD